MKNLFFGLLAASSLCTLGAACHREAPGDLPACPSGTVRLDSVWGWNGSPTCFGPRLGQPGQSQTYVINSQAELQAVNGCPDNIRVDFSRYTLLAVKTSSAACSNRGGQWAEYTCDGLVYHVVFVPGACQTPTELCYAVLVPKQPANARIVFDVQQR